MVPNRTSGNRKPILAITMGDYNGIGPEISLKAVRNQVVRRICTPVLVGSLDVLEFYARTLRLHLTLREINSPHEQMKGAGIPVIHFERMERLRVEPGSKQRIAGTYAGRAIERAAELCLEGLADGMVTAPVSKETMAKAGYVFPGQTEMLAHLSGASRVAMILVADSFRVALATVHVPLHRVSHVLTRHRLTQTLSIVGASLMRDFALRRARIAVLGLNPHAGENGLIGSEERRIITPVIRSFRMKGIQVDGPFPADGFFGAAMQNRYDAVIAMYHDQGLIPLKMQGFSRGVNYSAGLPIVRTSPDHGTAFDIAGNNVADPGSMIHAIWLAASIVRNRKKRSR